MQPSCAFVTAQRAENLLGSGRMRLLTGEGSPFGSRYAPTAMEE